VQSCRASSHPDTATLLSNCNSASILYVMFCASSSWSLSSFYATLPRCFPICSSHHPVFDAVSKVSTPFTLLEEDLFSDHGLPLLCTLLIVSYQLHTNQLHCQMAAFI
jgi:hypothetical protein